MVLWSLFNGATTFAWSLSSFIVTRALFGAAEGGFNPASSVAIAELYAREQRGRAKAFVLSAAQLGDAVGTFVVSAFIATVGWRYAFWTYSGLGLAIAAGFLAAFRTTKKITGRSTATKLKSPLYTIIRIPMVWKLAAVQFSIGSFFYGLVYWLPSYWVKVKGLNIAEMGTLMAVASLASFLFQNISGWIADMYAKGSEKILMCALLAIAGFSVFLMCTTQNVGVAFTFFAIGKASVAMCSAVIFIVALKYLPDAFIGMGAGIVNCGQQLAGMVAPAVFGYFIHIFHGSYLPVFISVIVTIVAAFVIALTVNTTNGASSREILA
jgi:MFS transporter, ACS family, hexuronate transporter